MRLWAGILAAVLALAGGSFAGGGPKVRIDLPEKGDVATPIPVAWMRGVAKDIGSLTLSVETKERTLTTDVRRGVTVLLWVDVAEAIASGRVGAQEKPEAVRDEVARAIRERAKRSGAVTATVEPAASGGLV